MGTGRSRRMLKLGNQLQLLFALPSSKAPSCDGISAATVIPWGICRTVGALQGSQGCLAGSTLPGSPHLSVLWVRVCWFLVWVGSGLGLGFGLCLVRVGIGLGLHLGLGWAGFGFGLGMDWIHIWGWVQIHIQFEDGFIFRLRSGPGFWAWIQVWLRIVRITVCFPAHFGIWVWVRAQVRSGAIPDPVQGGPRSGWHTSRGF